MRLLARAVLLATVFLPAIGVADNTWSTCTTITALTNEMADGNEFIVTLAGTNPVGSCIWEGAPAVFFTVGSNNVDSTNISSLLATALAASSTGRQVMIAYDASSCYGEVISIGGYSAQCPSL